jgi:protein-tyrosine phosphatase
MISVLFVCMGNICRSPAAEGVLREAAKEHSNLQLNIKSCGIGSWHVGQLPDERMRYAAKQRGIELVSKAQVFQKTFFEDFDYIFVADHEVLEHIQSYTKSESHKNKVHLTTAYSKNYKNEEVPDPYYSGDHAFDHVLDILEDSCEGFIDHLNSNSKA